MLVPPVQSKYHQTLDGIMKARVRTKQKKRGKNWCEANTSCIHQFSKVNS